MKALAGISAAAWMAAAGAALPHPHIFIDTGLHPVFDEEGRLAAVRVVWAYDEFYSLLVLEDLGLDGDYDGQLTPDEVAALNGFDMAWIEGYAGDLYLLAGGQELALSGPLEHDAAFSDGRIVTTHLRTVEPRPEVGKAPVVFRVYDPSFYTAYHVTLPTRIEGREGCAAEVIPPDLDAANRALQEALARLGPAEAVEDYDFPAVGDEFAEEVWLTCAPSS